MAQELDWTYLTNKFTVEGPQNRENATGENDQWLGGNNTANGILRVYWCLDQYRVSRIHDRVDCLDKISKHSLVGMGCTDFEDYILGPIPDRESPSFRELSAMYALLQANEPLS